MAKVIIYGSGIRYETPKVQGVAFTTFIANDVATLLKQINSEGATVLLIEELQSQINELVNVKRECLLNLKDQKVLIDALVRMLKVLTNWVKQNEIEF